MFVFMVFVSLSLGLIYKSTGVFYMQKKFQEVRLHLSYHVLHFYRVFEVIFKLEFLSHFLNVWV